MFVSYSHNMLNSTLHLFATNCLLAASTQILQTHIPGLPFKVLQNPWGWNRRLSTLTIPDPQEVYPMQGISVTSVFASASDLHWMDMMDDGRLPPWSFGFLLPVDWTLPSDWCWDWDTLWYKWLRRGRGVSRHGLVKAYQRTSLTSCRPEELKLLLQRSTKTSLFQHGPFVKTIQTYGKLRKQDHNRSKQTWTVEAGPDPYSCLGLSSGKPKLLKLLTVFTSDPQESFLQLVENPRRQRCSQTVLSAKESLDCDSVGNRRGWVRRLQQHHAHLCSRRFKGERWIKNGKGKSDTSRSL